MTGRCMSIKNSVEATGHSLGFFLEVCPDLGFGIRLRQIECPPSLVPFQDVLYSFQPSFGFTPLQKGDAAFFSSLLTVFSRELAMCCLFSMVLRGKLPVDSMAAVAVTWFVRNLPHI